LSSNINDMSVLNEDTIWMADDSGFDGGIFRTTNGGTNWTFQYQHNSNLERIYFFNRNIGFASSQNYIFRTTNSGLNWDIIPGQNGYNEIFFIDSLTGWKSRDSMRMTTDGGLTWNRQYVSNPNYFYMFGGLVSFSNVGKDTMWGVGFRIQYPNLRVKDVIQYTSNRGLNWSFQVPDTSLLSQQLWQCDFKNSLIGWTYTSSKGIHTLTGGDSVFIPVMDVRENNLQIVKMFELFQNFPNPFNPKTKFSYILKRKSRVLIKIYDIRGNEILTLDQGIVSEGFHEVLFDGSSYSSGIYFYRIEVISGKERFYDSKKMLLIK